MEAEWSAGEGKGGEIEKGRGDVSFVGWLPRTIILVRLFDSIRGRFEIYVHQLYQGLPNCTMTCPPIAIDSSKGHTWHGACYTTLPSMELGDPKTIGNIINIGHIDAPIRDAIVYLYTKTVLNGNIVELIFGLCCSTLLIRFYLIIYFVLIYCTSPANMPP